MTERLTIDLQAGELWLSLDPATGGAIAGLRFRGIDLLRPVADPRLTVQHGRPVAAYPLIPYANRIAWGRFSWAGQHIQLAANFAGDPHTIHGNGWMHPWSVVHLQDRQATLRFAHAPTADDDTEWPFTYLAEQQFDLHEDRLTIALSISNTDHRAWPAGLGLHPYIARTPETTLRFEADTVWTTGADGLPNVREAVHGAFAFENGRLLTDAAIDSCYAGWGGSATIAMPEHGLTLTIVAAPPLDHLQLYTPPDRDFLGLEPVSNMPDAINRLDSVSDQGLVVLQPGETLRALLTIGIRANDD